MNAPIIAIDGPAGCGKSTVARAVASRMGFIYVDTGALYRAIAHEALRLKLNLEDEMAISKIARNAHLEFKSQKGENLLFLDGQDISQKIRNSQVSEAASKVSSLAGVRAALLGIQRKLGKVGKSVIEGRDIGTVIFPEAHLKLFMRAAPEERAKRRHQELLARGETEFSQEEILQSILERDERDQKREMAPLIKAEDAVDLDTTQLSVDEVVELVITRIKEL